MLGIGSHTGGLNPVIGSKLYWSCVIPAMLYGCEILALSDAAIEKLEKQHRVFAKRIQSLPRNAPNITCLQTLGWPSIRAYVMQKVVTFITSVFCLDNNAIAKGILIDRVVQILNETNVTKNINLSPIRWYIQACKSLNLLYHVEDIIETGENLNKAELKNIVSQAVKQFDNKIHILEKLLYKDPGYTSGCSMDKWWWVSLEYPHVTPACKFMIKMKTANAPLKIKTFHYDHTTKTCPLCNTEDETVEHFLFTCPLLTSSRVILQNHLREITQNPIHSVQDIVNPSQHLDSCLVRDLGIIVYNMFKTRKQLIDDIT